MNDKACVADEQRRSTQAVRDTLVHAVAGINAWVTSKKPQTASARVGPIAESLHERARIGTRLLATALKIEVTKVVVRQDLVSPDLRLAQHLSQCRRRCVIQHLVSIKNQDPVAHRMREHCIAGVSKVMVPRYGSTAGERPRRRSSPLSPCCGLMSLCRLP